VTEGRRATGPEAVVLLHGLWFAGWTQVLLARRLRQRGFLTYPFSYPSVRSDLAENASALQAFASRLRAPVVHFVGHSLGGVVIRALFHHHPHQAPGRIVTLGSPHAGTYPGRALSRLAVGRAIVGRSVRDLVEGVPASWTSPDREIGVVVGLTSLGIGRLVPGLPHPNDGVVPRAEAEWTAATEVLELPVAHTGMLVSPVVARQVAHFLSRGRFER